MVNIPEPSIIEGLKLHQLVLDEVDRSLIHDIIVTGHSALYRPAKKSGKIIRFSRIILNDDREILMIEKNVNPRFEYISPAFCNIKMSELLKDPKYLETLLYDHISEFPDPI